MIVFQLDKKGLKKVAKTVMHHGVCGSINKVRKILTTSNKVEDENPFFDFPLPEITMPIMLFEMEIINTQMSVILLNFFAIRKYVNC